MVKLVSAIKDNLGECKPTWLNTNSVINRLDGGQTGFFKNVKKVSWWPWKIKYGEEFHGKIVEPGIVVSTSIYFDEEDDDNFMFANLEFKEINQ